MWWGKGGETTKTGGLGSLTLRAFVRLKCLGQFIERVAELDEFVDGLSTGQVLVSVGDGFEGIRLQDAEV